MIFETAETTIWRLMQLYTGRTGYQRGVKAEGLSANPPVIDMLGMDWVASHKSHASGKRCGWPRSVRAADMQSVHTWSDHPRD